MNVLHCFESPQEDAAGGADSAPGGANPAHDGADPALTGAELARYIDHTQLKPETTRAQIEKLCDEAVEYGFYAVCVNGYWTRLCAERVAGHDVAVATVVGFPLGAMSGETKAFEARRAAEAGAHEIDMVLNIGELLAGAEEAVRDDIAAVVAATPKQVKTKVILETSKLEEDRKVVACRLAKEAGADFVKTSTGFGGGGATVEDIALMRRSVGPDMGVKASGGVRTREDAVAMIRAGATRIGASAGVAIVSGGSGTGGY